MRDYTPSRMKPPHRFRLFPDPMSTLFVVVNVWDTQDAFLRYAGEDDAKIESDLATHGTCHGVTILNVSKKRVRKQPVFAEVNFYRGELGTEVITHELFHATVAWARRINFKWQRLGDDDAINSDEERLSYAHGRLCKQFVNRATAAGLYP